MKQTVKRYGFYAALAIIILFLIPLIVGDSLDFGTQEIIGYASIVISLSFVYFGIKHFRDKVNNGAVSFKKALVIGILISLFAAVAFGLLDYVYKIIYPNFTEEYYAYSIEQLEQTLPTAEFEVKKAELEEQKKMFMNPIVSFALMAITVLMIGFIISIISAVILQRKT